MTACPKLTELDLSECSSLDYVMVQSQSMRTLHIRGCLNVTKVGGAARGGKRGRWWGEGGALRD